MEDPADVRSLKISPVRTSFQSPWQYGIAERWVGSCRRKLFEHVIALNERHLKRLLGEYISYHYEDRTHLARTCEGNTGRENSVCGARSRDFSRAA